MTWNQETILTVFVALTGLAVLMQACVLLGIFISLRKTAKLVTDTTNEIKDSVLPMVQHTRELVERITPEVVTVTGGLAELTNTLRKETAGVHFSLSDAVARVQHQAQRLDGMLTAMLDRLDRLGCAIEASVAAPVRQANGIVAALKATIDTYRSFPSRPASGPGNQRPL
jgi:hypothetical protein